MILALLLAAFAVPAAATPVMAGPVVAGPAMGACHDAPPARHHGSDDGIVAHVCIGCVPVADWLSARVAAVVVPPAPPPFARVASLDIGDDIAPTLRPPRIA